MYFDEEFKTPDIFEGIYKMQMLRALILFANNGTSITYDG